MAKEIFVDASAWVAIGDPDDNYYAAAVPLYSRLLAEYQRLVTTNLILAESFVLLRKGVGLPRALDFLERARKSPRIETVFSTLELELEAETILRRYDDHDFSYADAVSFALMRERGIRETFTFDHQFRVMGFKCVP